MAKKKSPASGETGSGPQPTARKRSARTSVASADQSPITGGTPSTSEEVQLAVAHDLTSSVIAPQQPSYQEIAEAAYQRYLNRGGVDGQDFDD